jgi:hypothetical protein
MELAVVPNPRTHFPFGIGGVDEVVCPGVNVGQGDHRIRRDPSVPQEILDCPPKLVFLIDSSLTWKEIDVGHPAIKLALQKLQQERLKCLFGSSFD